MSSSYKSINSIWARYSVTIPISSHLFCPNCLSKFTLSYLLRMLHWINVANIIEFATTMTLQMLLERHQTTNSLFSSNVVFPLQVLICIDPIQRMRKTNSSEGLSNVLNDIWGTSVLTFTTKRSLLESAYVPLCLSTDSLPSFFVIDALMAFRERKLFAIK